MLFTWSSCCPAFASRSLFSTSGEKWQPLAIRLLLEHGFWWETWLWCLGENIDSSRRAAGGKNKLFSSFSNGFSMFFPRPQREATSKSRLQRVLNLLKYVPDKPPTPPPVQTWKLGTESSWKLLLNSAEFIVPTAVSAISVTVTSWGLYSHAGGEAPWDANYNIFLAWASVFRFSFVLASGPVSVVSQLMLIDDTWCYMMLIDVSCIYTTV